MSVAPATAALPAIVSPTGTNGADPSPAAPVGGTPDQDPTTLPRRGPGRPKGSITKTEVEKKADRRAYDLRRKAELRAKLSTVSPNPAPAQPAPTIAGAIAIGVDYQAFGKECAFLFVAGGTLAFGEEWKPDNDEELRNLQEAFGSWARYHGMTKLSPDLTLILTCGSYGLARFTRSERVQSRGAKVWHWLKTSMHFGRKNPASST